MDIRRRNLMGQTPIAANITIENIKGSWGESSTTISGYRVYESKGSHHVGNGYDLAKVTFSGYPNFTFLYGSYAESSYDYMKISPLDYASAQNWTGSSSSGHLLSTSGKQSSDAPNLSYTFTNDGGEHFFYILYRKDGNVNSGTDRGYIAFRQNNYLDIDTDSIVANHRSQIKTISINSDQSWTINTDFDWIHVSESEGSGSKTVNITLDPNLSTNARQGVIQINSDVKSVHVSIEQSAYDIITTDSLIIEKNQIKSISITAELELSISYESDWFTCELSNEGIVYTISVTMTTTSDSPLESNILLQSGGIQRNLKIQYIPFRPFFEFPLTSSTELIQGLTPYTERNVTFSDSGVFVNSDSAALIYKSAQFDNVLSVYVETIFTATNGYGYMYIFSINNQDNSQSWIGIGRNNSSGKLQVTYGQSGYGYIDSTTNIPLELNTNYKIGMALSSSGGVICVNGNTYTVSTSYEHNLLQYDLFVGGSWRQRTDGQRNMRGYVKNLKLYDKTLTSEELIQLTS